MPRTSAVALALGLGLATAAGCARRTAAPRTLNAALILLPHDTVPIHASASAHPCATGAGMLFVGIDGGVGVLAWTSADKALASGDYPILTRGDTTTRRGAKASVRFMSGAAGRGVTLDSGTVTLTLGDRVGARVRGSGLEPAAGRRAMLDAEFRPVPLARDSVACQ